MSYSVYTIHQAKYVNGRLTEVVILCRDEPEPPVFFYEETVMTVEKVIDHLYQGDLIYAQWGNESFPIRTIRLENGEESIEVAHSTSTGVTSSLAGLPRFETV